MTNAEEFLPQIFSKSPTEEDKRRFWIEIFKANELTPADTFPDRIKVCYRLTRMLAYIKGIVTASQTLEEGTRITPDPWRNEVTYFSAQIPPDVKFRSLQIQRAPLSLQPPPQAYSNKQPVPPSEDRRLRRWLILMGRLTRHIGITNTEVGRRGIRGLLDPETVRSLWIEPEILMSWESALLAEFLDEQLDKGIYEGQNELRKKHGLTVTESRILGDLARTAAPDITADSIETKKALMELRIDKFIKQARKDADARAELQALKLLAIIQGLNKVEPENDLKGMVQIVAEVSKEQGEGEEEDDE